MGRGILSSKERKGLVEYIEGYNALVKNPEIADPLRDMVIVVFSPWVTMARFALYVDSCKTIEKTISVSYTHLRAHGT